MWMCMLCMGTETRRGTHEPYIQRYYHTRCFLFFAKVEKDLRTTPGNSHTVTRHGPTTLCPSAPCPRHTHTPHTPHPGRVPVLCVFGTIWLSQATRREVYVMHSPRKRRHVASLRGTADAWNASCDQCGGEGGTLVLCLDRGGLGLS